MMEMIKSYGWAALALGFVLDLLIGDPIGRWHPVIAIGSLISKTEKVLRRIFPATPSGEMVGGTFLAIIVSGVSFFVPWLLLLFAYRFYPPAGFLLETIGCYYILATNSLKTESMKVAEALEKQGIAAGRRAVARIVGRDSARLSEEGILKATIETIAENASDGVIAPMLFLAVGGPAWGFFYKAVNTMDSMVGYKNEKYLYFGRTAARMDDLLNFLPARITAWLLILGAGIVGYSMPGACQIYRRDRKNHDSPNSAQPEAAMAGALGIQLAGAAYYFGKRKEKPTIGDRCRAVETADVKRANKLLYAAAGLGLLLCLTVRAAHMLW